MLLNSVTHGRLRIVSIEYTEMREKGSETLYHVEIVLCKAEQKEMPSLGKPKKDVKNDKKIGHIY